MDDHFDNGVVLKLLESSGKVEAVYPQLAAIPNTDNPQFNL